MSKSVNPAAEALFRQAEERRRAAEAASRRPAEIAARLKALRIELGFASVREFTQYLCTISGVSIGRSAVSNWVNGYTYPDMECMAALCSEHPISLEWLILGRLDPPPSGLMLRVEARLTASQSEEVQQAEEPPELEASAKRDRRRRGEDKPQHQAAKASATPHPKEGGASTAGALRRRALAG